MNIIIDQTSFSNRMFLFFKMIFSHLYKSMKSVAGIEFSWNRERENGVLQKCLWLQGSHVFCLEPCASGSDLPLLLHKTFRGYWWLYWFLYQRKSPLHLCQVKLIDCFQQVECFRQSLAVVHRLIWPKNSSKHFILCRKFAKQQLEIALQLWKCQVYLHRQLFLVGWFY